ncbi:phage distal tail protein [Mogibacterium timidum]|uniref:phage distal tail protein n=1 Tax=Mogibacterium timidum TaxID=35519 RepID=UPI00248B4D11|nr:phage tail domain-containing protein [Mogibacterium timidum]
MKNKGYCVRAIRSDGLIFNYENDDWMMTSLDGTEFPQIEVFTEAKGIGDGDLITGHRKGSRTVEIATVPRNYNDGDYRELRRAALFFHNPSFTFDLEITYMRDTKIAKGCAIKGLTFPTERYRKNASLKVSYLSPHGELFAIGEEKTNLSNITARWAVARAYTGSNKLLYSTEDRSDSIIIDYLGSVKTNPVIKIVADGYVKDLVIKIGDIVCNLNTTLKNGDVVVIDGSKAYATLNGEMIRSVEDFRKLKLTPGMNLISITSSSGNAFKSELTYIGRYEGI